MSETGMFVLSVVTPPEGAAKYGKATVSNPFPERDQLHTVAYWAMRKRAPWMHPDEISRYAGQVTTKVVGAETVEASTGLRFRVDTAEDAPHPCSCCQRLVLPTVHALAHADDAVCTGCFTWDRNIPACLPESSAHAQEGE